MQRKRETRNRLAVIGLLLWAGAWPSLATNDVGDPNCAVVDVMQANRLVDMDPGDCFWLTVPVASGFAGVEVHREGDRGLTWLKAGEFLLVQYDESGEYTTRFRTARARRLAPLTVRVFAPPAGWEGVWGRNGQRKAGGGRLWCWPAAQVVRSSAWDRCTRGGMERHRPRWTSIRYGLCHKGREIAR